MPRRKRAVVESDDEYSNTKSPNTPKGSIQAAFAKANLNKQHLLAGDSPSKQGKTSPAQVSPSKNKSSQPNSTTNSPAGKTRTIQSFFNTATLKQGSKASVSPSKVSDQEFDVENDLIVDSSDDDAASFSTQSLISGKKRKITSSEDASKPQIPASQKFLINRFKQNGAGTQPEPSRSSTRKVEQRPWTEQYGPIDLDELAVHKKKVQDVRDWLAQTIAGKGRERLLVLKGGAGTGKTTTIRLLARKLGLRVTEWRNPDVFIGNGPGTSLAAQFEEFVNHTRTFGSLDFSETKHGDKSEEPSGSGHILLVEEFPNTYSQSSSAVQGFRNAVLHYLAATTPSVDDFFHQKSTQTPVVPVIMIISESLLTTTTAAADSFTAHRLLGSEILNHIGTSVIEFNPIAATFMSKALDLILKKEARRSGRRFAPGPAVLKHIAEIGDIRSAVSALEFFCLHKGDEADWSGKIQFAKGKRASGTVEPTSMEKQSLEMITQRENTLGIFHAVGKVVYNKRELPTATDTPPPQPPPWLPQYHRPKKSEVDVDALLNELGTDIHVFMLALHENYVLSCTDISDEDTLDSVNGCLDSLSDSDLLCPDRFATNQSRYTFQGTTTDTLRQDEISFDISVRGMLFNLPHPVKRSNPPADYVSGRGKAGRGTTAFQMLYPTSLRLWRKKEQIQDLVNSFNDKYRKGQFEEEIFVRKRQPQAPGGVLSWKKNNHFSHTDDPKVSQSGQDTGLLVRGASKSELLLERLPYLYLIEKRKPASARSLLSRQLDRVVSFSGLTNILVNEEEPEVADDAGTEQWSTDKPAEGTPARRKGIGMKIKSAENIQKDVEGLVLSDDDIVDDE